MSGFKDIRAQGRAAKKSNDDNTDGKGEVIDTGVRMFSVHDCPYGPGDNRDAWIAGFGGAEEPVEQVDTSTPTTEDVRTETAEPVRKGAKAKTAKGKADATKVVTDVTGTGETSLQTKVKQVDPEASDRVPTPETVIGDPAASQGPNDANVMHTDAADKLM